MAFAINDTGLERDVVQVVFDDPVIIESRHEEGGPDRVYDVAIPGNPVGVEYARTQDQAFFRIRARLVDAADVAILETLLAGSGPVVFKPKAGDAGTVTCLFGERKDHEFELYNGPIPDAAADGSALSSLLTQYNVTLSLLRLE